MRMKNEDFSKLEMGIHSKYYSSAMIPNAPKLKNKRYDRPVLVENPEGVCIQYVRNGMGRLKIWDKELPLRPGLVVMQFSGQLLHYIPDAGQTVDVANICSSVGTEIYLYKCPYYNTSVLGVITSTDILYAQTQGVDKTRIERILENFAREEKFTDELSEKQSILLLMELLGVLLYKLFDNGTD